MKKFLERHSAAFLVSAAVLFLTVCVLCACMYYDFRADQELAQSQDYLHTALLKTNVRRLEAALSEENRMTSYHFALTAAENAASAGMGDDALFFRKISGGITDGATNMTDIAAAVGEYLDTGKVPQEFTLSYDTAENSADSEMAYEPASVSYFRELAAEECASSIVGVDGLLRRAEKCRDGEFVFTCQNAYAVVDARSGSPIEAGISIVPGEARLSEADCAGYAHDFLRTYFPPDIARAANLTSVTPDNANGTYEFVFRSGEREIRLAVKRDTGRIIRLIAR